MLHRSVEPARCKRTLCTVPIDTMKDMLNDGRNESLLVACKTADFGWPTYGFCCRMNCLEKYLPKMISGG